MKDTFVFYPSAQQDQMKLKKTEIQNSSVEIVVVRGAFKREKSSIQSGSLATLMAELSFVTTVAGQ